MVHPGRILQELVGGIETRVLGGPVFQGRLAGLELDLHLAAAEDLVFFIREIDGLDAFREVDDGRVSRAHEPPFGAEVGIQCENAVAIGIRAHVQLIDQGVVVREGTFKS